MSPFSQSLFRTRSLFQRVFSCEIGVDTAEHEPSKISIFIPHPGKSISHLSPIDLGEHRHDREVDRQLLHAGQREDPGRHLVAGKEVLQVRGRVADAGEERDRHLGGHFELAKLDEINKISK